MGPAVTDMDLAAEGILGNFEGQAVTEVGVEIRNAAGGLNESLKVDKVMMTKGDSCFVVLRCDVVDVHFPNVKGEEDKCRRVHVMRATDATIMEGASLQKAIDSQRARNQAARDAASGQGSMVPDERV